MTLIIYKKLPDFDYQATENIYYLIIIVVSVYNPEICKMQKA
jgi:hypothetical protein